MKIPNPKDTCKLGQGSECCIYLLAGPGGFICGYSDKLLKSQLTKRLLAGTTNAKGIGEWSKCIANKED